MPLRVITTTYVGATEQRAVDALVRRFGAQVQDQLRDALDPAARQGVAVPPRLGIRHRLRRQLQPLPVRAARRPGVERAAVVGRHARAAAQVRRHVRQLLGRPGVRRPTTRTTPTTSSGCDEALGRDRFATATAARAVRTGGPAVSAPGRRSWRRSSRERTVHDRHRNLVVAATGTGKTVVAALDYARLRSDPAARPAAVRRASPGDPRAVAAHLPRGAGRRRLRRDVRRRRPPGAVASTCSPVSSRWPRTASTSIPPDHFDVVVIDEFHHAEAPTYRRLLDHLRPRELLGLTATPERGDGVDVRERSSTAAPPTSCGCGTPWPPTCSCRSTTSASHDDVDLQRHRVEARHLRHRRRSTTSTPATTPARPRSSARRATRSPTSAGCGRSASACRSRTREYMAGVFNRGRDPQPRRVGGYAAGRARGGAPARCGRGRSTACSRSTCSTRASTSRRSTRCCSCGPRRARRCSCSSSAAACAARRARRC